MYRFSFFLGGIILKKAISMLLSVLMIVSMFSIACVQVSAANVQEYFTVTSTGFSNNEITYYISLNPNQPQINSVILNFSFDSNVLKVVEDKSGAVGEKNSYGEFDANVDGLYEKGVNKTTGKYVVAFFNPNGASVGASAVSFVKVTFEAISENRPLTSVGFECVEFVSDDGDSSNDKTKATDPVVFDEDSFLTLNAVKNKEVLSNAKGLKFVWEAVTGAEWYKIYRRATGETEWSVIAEQVLAPETSYVDEITGDDLGKVFEYVAEPWNSFGSVPHSETGVEGKYFGTIDYIDAVMTETGALVSWTALEDAESYSLYQMAEDDADWSYVDDVEETSCHSKALESGKKYFFKVKAHSEGYLAETSVDPKELVFLGAPDDVYAAIFDNAITLTWSQVNGAESYNVYKKNADGETYELISNVADNVDGAFEFVDEDVDNGELYKYIIQSVNSVTESVIGEKCTAVRKLPVTKNVTAELGENGILVKWDADDFADGYRVFRKEVDSTGWSAIGSSDTNEYFDMRVATGKTYVYAVATFSDGGVYEAQNSVASNEIVFVALPVINSAVAYGDKITISWKKIVGAELYDVYKYNTEDQAWELVDTVDVNSFDDYDVVGGETYGYSVVAVVGDKTSLFDAEGVWVKYLSAPTGLSAENISEGVKLSWNQVAGAEEYIVYHKIGSSEYQEIARFESNTTTYIDTAATTGQDNFYYVYARGGLTYSEPAEVSIRYLAAPDVTSVSYVNRTGVIMVTWGKIIGADSYNVYRKSGNSTEWEFIGTTTTNSFNDSNVFYTNDYSYTVQACSGDSYSDFDKTGESFSLQFNGTPTLRYVSNRWRCVVGSKYDYTYKGLVEYEGSFYYVANGYVDWKYSGFVSYYNEDYYVTDGYLDFYGSTLAQVDGKWCYVEGGKLKPGVTTLVNYYGDWYYVKDGTLASDYTGLVNYDGGWYYVVNGYLDWNQTTLVNYGGYWYYVENGIVKWDCDTLVSYYGDWYYVKGGMLASDYTGLVNFYGEWYYVVNGYLDRNQTTLVNHNGCWYYVVNGYLDWSQTTLVNFYGGWYYVENGMVKWDCDTLVNYYGDWFYVKGGMLASDYTGLVNYYDCWYYVVNGYLDWSQNTLAELGGTWFYINNATIDWSYTGRFEHDGATAEIENGVVKFWTKVDVVNPVY